MEERLQKVLAHAGVASRRAAEGLIREGRVTVNGRVVTELGSKADPLRDDVRLDGERLRAERHRVLALHKPPGVMTTLADPEGRPTIRDFLPPGGERVYPVGRLDFNTAGLLLLTNDGELAARLMHPRYGVPRTYRVKVNGAPGPATLARLRRGVKLDDGVTGPAEVEIERSLPTKSWLRITIREGKKREIRRMLETLGHLVDRLIRVRFGPIELGRLPIGALRELDEPQIAALRAAVGLGAARSANLTSSGGAANQRRSSRARAAMRGVEQSGSSRGS